MKAIIMPQIGQDIPAGKIVQWLKQEGDPVEKGEVVLVVESEKANFEIEAEDSGVLLKILHHTGEEVPILQPVGYVGSPGERFDTHQAKSPDEAPVPASEQAEQSKDKLTPRPQTQPARILASPAVRRLAGERGVDITGLRGTGPEGRITKDDVLAAGDGGDKTC